MERVQFQQEQMLAELKDLEEKGLFSQNEIKTIMKKRTAFETALVRRIPKKSDFLRYAEYELQLETLRRRRAERLNVQGAPSLSDYALVRRQFHIFERALRKFRADVALWVQYIELARREGARALVGRISARALQLHPNTPALYVHAAQHEAAPAARALLQRGLRLNGESVELWAAYVRFEVGFVERMRRRWAVLGVDEPREEDAGEEDADVGEEARREVMRGAIVEAVMEEAAKAVPRLALFHALDELLRAYPTPLRTALLEHLHALLLKTLPADPAALAMHATRNLRADSLDSAEFVDALRDANETLLAHARADPAGVSAAYADFVAEWCARDIDANLRLYLTGSLQTVAALAPASARALAVHLRLCPGERRGAQYTRRAAGSSEVWLARLEGVRGTGDARRVWDAARRSVDAAEVWLWGVEAGVGEARAVCEELLRESVGAGAGALHTALLTHYATRVLRPAGPAARLADTQRVMRAYLPGAAFFRAVFADEAALADASEAVLAVLYGGWRACAGEGAAAALAWAAWLLGDGQGARAAEAVAGTGAEGRWRALLDGGST